MKAWYEENCNEPNQVALLTEHLGKEIQGRRGEGVQENGEKGERA